MKKRPLIEVGGVGEGEPGPIVKLFHKSDDRYPGYCRNHGNEYELTA